MQLENLKRYKSFCDESDGKSSSPSCPMSCTRTWVTEPEPARYTTEQCESRVPPSFAPGLELPGGPEPEPRFIRGNYGLKYMPTHSNSFQTMMNLRSVANSVKVTFNAPYVNNPALPYGMTPYPTWWTTMTDFTTRK